jgi:hypothetical protein
MATVFLVPAGSDSAPGAQSGDYLLRPDGDRYEVGRVDGTCTWIGTLDASLLPDLPQVDAAQEAPEQERALTAARGLESAEANRGG